MSLRCYILASALLCSPGLCIGVEQPIKFDAPTGWKCRFDEDKATFVITKHVETDEKGRLPFPSMLILKRSPSSYEPNDTRGHIEQVASELRKKAPQDTFTIAGIAGNSFKGHLVYHKIPWNGLSATYEVSNGKAVWFGTYTGDESDFAIVVKILRSLH